MLEWVLFDFALLENADEAVWGKASVDVRLYQTTWQPKWAPGGSVL